MLSSFSRLATLLLSSATLSLSAPAPIPRSRSRFSKRAGLPEVVIYATGGTIAGSSADTTDVTGYQAGAVAIQTLVDAVPQIANVSDVTGVQFSNVGSNELNTSMIHKLSNQINGQFKANESVAGVVVTHGTGVYPPISFPHLSFPFPAFFFLLR